MDLNENQRKRKNLFGSAEKNRKYNKNEGIGYDNQDL